MKMSRVTVEMAMMVVVVMSWSVLQGAEAQGSVTCLSVGGWGAPYNDATQLVDSFSGTDPICTNGCSSITSGGWNAVATAWAPLSAAGATYCYNSADFVNFLNLVVEQCNDPSTQTVQGYYEVSPGVNAVLTSTACQPYNCVW